MVEENIWSSSEILLSVSVIAVTPFMFLIDERTKCSFVEV
jgi:hypothetical protein